MNKITVRLQDDTVGNITPNKINFRTVVNSAIGTTRECNDGSGCDSFTISKNEVEGIADNLTTWYEEEYENDECIVECTIEEAEEYFDKTYPEIEQ